MRKIPKKINTFSIFSDKALLILISVVTLLLQLISFATTWDGAKVYLDNIFPYAALCFAIAIQATSYFFGNSLRQKVRPLKLIALFSAICCSIYFSYIGIYNSVNSPVTYLQENYLRISEDLSQLYHAELNTAQTDARMAVQEASSSILTRYTSLITEQENILACRTALEETSPEYSTGLKAPRQNAYESYEDYAAAYQAYINSISQSKNTETDAQRTAILNSYGFASMEELNTGLQNNTSALSTLQNTLGATEEAPVPDILSALTTELLSAIQSTSQGIAFSARESADFDRLLQAADLCGYHIPNTTLIQALNQCAKLNSQPPIADYTTLTNALPGGTVNNANAMELKSAMDSEIMATILQLNSVLPENSRLDTSDPRFQITDLYFIPILALQQEETVLTARFSLLFAGLIDILSLLFAVSLRDKKPLWKRRTLLFNQVEEYEPLIYASLPSASGTLQPLAEFLALFNPSPYTEAEGYMLCGNPENMQKYNSLIALLCQTNLAKLLPAGFQGNEKDTLLLKARFVFWANTKMYEEKMYE